VSKLLSMTLALSIATMTQAASLLLPAGADYATVELNNPWDMSDSGDAYPLLWTHNLKSLSFSDGILSASARDTDPHFWAMFPQVASSTATLDMPQNFIDADRYTKLSYYMWLPDTVIPGAKTGRVVWHFGGYTAAEVNANYAESPLFSVYPGWHLYTFDMKTLVPGTGRPWAGKVAGLRIDPCLGCNTDFKLDWIRVTDPSDTASRLKDSRLGSAALLVDSDTDTSNGAVTTLPKQSDGSYAFDGLAPGSYRVAPISDEEYALSQRGKSWTFNTINDFNWASRSGWTKEGIVGGQFQGTTNASSSFLLLDVPDSRPIDASKYRYLRVKMNLSSVPAQTAGMLIFWGTQTGIPVSFSSFIPVKAGSNEYSVDLGASADWKGLLRTLRIDPLVGPNAGSGVTVQISSVTLSTVSTPSAGASTVSYLADTVVVNTPPVITLLSPGLKTGTDYAQSVLGGAWDMANQFSVKQPRNLTGADFVTSIPDLNLSGTFFKGVSAQAPAGAGEGDPGVHLIYQENTNPIDAAKFRTMHFKMYVPFDAGNAQELQDGAVARVIWQEFDGDTGLTTDDILLLPGMHDYWVDMPNVLLEPASSRRWSNFIRYLRIDPLEYKAPHTFYLDEVSLHALPTALNNLSVSLSLDATSQGKFTVTTFVDNAQVGVFQNVSAGLQGFNVDVSRLAAGQHTFKVCAYDGSNTTCAKSPLPFLKTSDALAISSSDIDSVFNWAESALPSLLKPSGERSSYMGAYYTRCYKKSGQCLGALDGILYYYDSKQILNLGNQAPFIAQARAGGF